MVLKIGLQFSSLNPAYLIALLQSCHLIHQALLVCFFHLPSNAWFAEHLWGPLALVIFQFTRGGLKRETQYNYAITHIPWTAIVPEFHRSSSGLASPKLKWLAARIFSSRTVFWVHYGWQLLSPGLTIPAARVHATFHRIGVRQSFIKNLFVKNLFYSLSVLQRNKGQLPYLLEYKTPLKHKTRFFLSIVETFFV
jgi:hypothetical protein